MQKNTSGASSEGSVNTTDTINAIEKAKLNNLDANASECSIHNECSANKIWESY